jgi:transcriptional regulator with XRE-family HTH domain
MLCIMEGRRMDRQGETMGERFKRLREQARMSQRELSERSGIPLRTLCNWEQGQRVPRLDHAVQLARTLGVDMNTLTGFGEPEVERPKRRGQK